MTRRDNFRLQVLFSPAAEKSRQERSVAPGQDVYGNIRRLDNLLGNFDYLLKSVQNDLTTYETQLASAKVEAEAEKSFPQEDELKTKLACLDVLNILLNMDKPENEIMDGDVGAVISWFPKSHVHCKNKQALFSEQRKKSACLFTANEYYQQDEMPHQVPELLNVPTDIYSFAYLK